MIGNIYVRRVRTVLAIAAVAGLAMAGAAQAQVHVRVGDLSQTGGADAFNARVDRAARSVCQGISAADLARMEACRAGVREEALAQLSAAQRAEIEMPHRGMAEGGDMARNGAMGAH
jgi:UrcA family protein